MNFNIFAFRKIIVAFLILSILKSFYIYGTNTSNKMSGNNKLKLASSINLHSNKENVKNNQSCSSLVSKIKIYIVGLVLEWFPINKPEGEKGYIFLNTYLWLKQGGFKIIPIFPWYTNNQLKEILKIVNSVFWMGGMQNFEPDNSGKVEQFNKNILNIVESRKLPLLVVCQGFQLLVNLYAGKNILTNYNNDRGLYKNDFFVKTDQIKIEDNYHLKYFLDSNNQELSNLVEDISKDALFKKFELNDIMDFNSKNVNFHFHKWGVSPEDFTNKYSLNKILEISSIGKDYNNKEFINSIYHKYLPIHGVQFHPEYSNDMSFKRNLGEDYESSKKISHKILQGFKSVIDSYHSNNCEKEEIDINDEMLDSAYELSNLSLVITDEYFTGKSNVMGYMFNKENFPFKFNISPK